MRLNKSHKLKGTLICVEGIDGSGKSTQLKILHDWLLQTTKDVIFTEWNSSRLISQTTKLAKKKFMLSPRTFSILHAVDFADRLEQTIIPARNYSFAWLFYKKEDILLDICHCDHIRFYSCCKDEGYTRSMVLPLFCLMHFYDDEYNCMCVCCDTRR